MHVKISKQPFLFRIARAMGPPLQLTRKKPRRFRFLFAHSVPDTAKYLSPILSSAPKTVCEPIFRKQLGSPDSPGSSF
jgi:hypothetical protein